MMLPMFEKDYLDKSLEELIRIRNKIIRDLRRYERSNVFKRATIQNPEGVYVYTTPGPDIEYSLNNDNLMMITRLIKDKLQEKQAKDFVTE